MSSLARKSDAYPTPSWHSKAVTRANLAVITGGKANRIAGLRTPLRSGSSMAFVTICGALLVIAIAGVLVLNTIVVNRSYEMARLQTKVQIVNQDVQSKQEQLRRTQAELPAKAAELGMVPVDMPEIIDVTKYTAEIANAMLGQTGARG